MSEKNSKNENPFGEKKPTPPKFNMYWIWGILVLGFIVISFFPSNEGKKTNWNEEIGRAHV